MINKTNSGDVLIPIGQEILILADLTPVTLSYSMVALSLRSLVVRILSPSPHQKRNLWQPVSVDKRSSTYARYSLIFIRLRIALPLSMKII
jgi:hypothetical protein